MLHVLSYPRNSNHPTEFCLHKFQPRNVPPPSDSPLGAETATPPCQQHWAAAVNPDKATRRGFVTVYYAAAVNPDKTAPEATGAPTGKTSKA